MKIRYVDSDGPDSTSTQGYAFKRGEWVEVTDDFAIMKLSRNPGFEVYLESMTNSSENVQAPVVAPKRRGRPKLNR